MAGSALFSQAVKVGSTVYVSGIVGIDPKTNGLAGSTIQEETRQALINCESILRAAGERFKMWSMLLVLLARRRPESGPARQTRESLGSIPQKKPKRPYGETLWCEVQSPNSRRSIGSLTGTRCSCASDVCYGGTPSSEPIPRVAVIYRVPFLTSRLRFGSMACRTAVPIRAAIAPAIPQSWRQRPQATQPITQGQTRSRPNRAVGTRRRSKSRIDPTEARCRARSNLFASRQLLPEVAINRMNS